MCLQFQGPVLVMKNQNYVETVFLQKIITLVLLTLTDTYSYLGVIFKYKGTVLETKNKLVEQAENA
jgi:hypothetical protein